MADSFAPASAGPTVDGALSATVVVAAVVDVPLRTGSWVVWVAQAASPTMVAASQTYLCLLNFISVKAEAVPYV
jgi:hypothetical protein